MVAKLSKSRKSFLDNPLTKVSRILKSFFTQISIASSNGMLVHKASTVNSFCVISDRMGTKNFASFYVGVPIAERIGLNGGSPFLWGLCTLADP